MIVLRRYKVFIVVLGVLLLSGCMSMNAPGSVRMYEGSKPAGEIVKFIIPAALDLLILDEKNFKDSPVISDGHYTLELLPGKHRFKIIYARMWGSEALGTFVESDAFYFNVDTTAGSVYEFKHNGPADLSDADYSDIDDIKIWLEDKNTGRQIKAVGVRDYGNIISRYVLGKDKPLKADVAAESATVKAKAKQAEQKDNNAKALAKVQQKAIRQLQFWWKIADSKQRDAFQRWLVTLKDANTDKTADSMQHKALEQLKFWWKLADIKQRESFLLWVGK